MTDPNLANIAEVIGETFGVPTKFRTETTRKGDSLEITLSVVLPKLEFEPATGTLRVFAPPLDW